MCDQAAQRVLAAVTYFDERMYEACKENSRTFGVLQK
jgi:hypothetical protein